MFLVCGRATRQAGAYVYNLDTINVTVAARDLIGGFFFFFQAEDGIRDLVRSRGLGDVYKRQPGALSHACAGAPHCHPAPV